jgi:hypothetical protein
VELERATALAAVGEDAFPVAREGPGAGCARVDLAGQWAPRRVGPSRSGSVVLGT